MARREAGSKAAPVVARHYVLFGETARLRKDGSELPPEPADLRLREVLAEVARQPFMSVEVRDTAMAAVSKTTASLHFFRSHPDPTVRAMGMNGVLGALGIADHYGGGEELAAHLKAQAEVVGKGLGPAKARRKKASKAESQAAAKARKLLRPLVFAAWNADCDLLKRPNGTAAKVFDRFTRVIKAHVQPGSKWMPPERCAFATDEAHTDAEMKYIERMMNPIRSLRDEYMRKHPAV